jgi:hypothetical protein
VEAGRQVQLQNLNVQDDKLLIRASVALEDLKRRIEERIRHVDAVFSAVCSLTSG